MAKKLSISEFKSVLDFYNYTMPLNIYKIKKKATSVIIKKMCSSNYDCNKKYKLLLSILNKRKILSPNKKNHYHKTKKKNRFKQKYTRIYSPINYL